MALTQDEKRIVLKWIKLILKERKKAVGGQAFRFVLRLLRDVIRTGIINQNLQEISSMIWEQLYRDSIKPKKAKKGKESRFVHKRRIEIEVKKEGD